MSKPTYHYLKGVLWCIGALFIGCANDVVAQHVSRQGVDPLTIALARLAIGALSLLPWILRTGRNDGLRHHPYVHLLRGVLTFLAIFLWILGLSKSSVVTATLVGFTTPIFAFILAPWLLGERKTKYLGVATLLGFLGMCITLYPQGMSWDTHAIFFVLAVLCFVSLDMLAKRYVCDASRLDVLFYGNVVAAMCAFVPWYLHGMVPPKETWLMLCLLGVGGNLLLYCLLTAYGYADLMALAPLRYLEIVFAMGLNYVCFAQVPTWHEWMGSLVIIPTSFCVVMLTQRSKDKP